VLIPAEIEELSRSFYIVGSPTLMGEILADLKKPLNDKKLPEEMVRALARKMTQGSAAHPATFRKLAFHNLDGVRVPMRGQVPIDGDAPNVAVVNGGRGMLYDKTPEQNIWRQWAAGNFTTKDHDTAVRWRTGIERVNLRAIGDSWKQYALAHFAHSRTISDLVTEVDQHLASPRRETQRSHLHILADFLNIPVTRDLPAIIFLAHGCKLTTVAPYAATILRLYLTFVAGIAKGLIGPRPSHYIDLQYLFYVPFCMVFASDDNLHRRLWPATSGQNMLITAAELKADLARRIQLQNEGQPTFHHGYPIPLDDSIITKAMDHAFGARWRTRLGRDDDDIMKPGTRIDDLPPLHRDRIRSAFSAFDAIREDEADRTLKSPSCSQHRIVQGKDPQ